MTRYDAIASRYAGSVVQLEVLRSIHRCYDTYIQKPDRAADTLTQMRTVFLQMPDGQFDRTSPVRTREYWQKWFDEISPRKN